VHHSVFGKPEIHNYGYDQDGGTKQGQKNDSNDRNRQAFTDIAKIGIAGVVVTSCSAHVSFQLLVDAVLNPIR
jgi:hypothetical protein